MPCFCLIRIYSFKMTEAVQESINRLASKSLEIPIKKRKSELIRLQSLLVENQDELLAALFNDLHKSQAEGYMTEIAMVLNGIDDALRTIDEFVRDEQVSIGKWALLMNLKGSVRHLPLGMVLIIGAWNYPIQLLLLPLVGAIAGGNKVSQCLRIGRDEA
jgi:aldehyde dehydrogenase (NAD+)